VLRKGHIIGEDATAGAWVRIAENEFTMPYNAASPFAEIRLSAGTAGIPPIFPDGTLAAKTDEAVGIECQ
jgi:hypothetical protein